LALRLLISRSNNHNLWVNVDPPYHGVEVDVEDKGEEDNRTSKRQTCLRTRGRIVQAVVEGVWISTLVNSSRKGANGLERMLKPILRVEEREWEVAAIGVRKQDIATMSKLFSFSFFFYYFQEGFFFDFVFFFFDFSL
jgi:hypothetical protein